LNDRTQEDKKTSDDANVRRLCLWVVCNAYVNELMYTLSFTAATSSPLLSFMLLLSGFSSLHSYGVVWTFSCFSTTFLWNGIKHPVVELSSFATEDCFTIVSVDFEFSKLVTRFLVYGQAKRSDLDLHSVLGKSLFDFEENGVTIFGVLVLFSTCFLLHSDLSTAFSFEKCSASLEGI